MLGCRPGIPPCSARLYSLSSSSSLASPTPPLYNVPSSPPPAGPSRVQAHQRCPFLFKTLLHRPSIPLSSALLLSSASLHLQLFLPFQRVTKTLFAQAGPSLTLLPSQPLTLFVPVRLSFSPTLPLRTASPFTPTRPHRASPRRQKSRSNASAVLPQLVLKHSLDPATSPSILFTTRRLPEATVLEVRDA